jgi:hypothetical protein
LQPFLIKDDPRARCTTEGIKQCRNFGPRKAARLKSSELTQLCNDKIDDVRAFNAMRQQVLEAEGHDALDTSAVAVVYFWLDFWDSPDGRMLGQNAVDGILSALHVAHAAVYLVSYEDTPLGRVGCPSGVVCARA